MIIGMVLLLLLNLNRYKYETGFHGCPVPADIRETPSKGGSQRHRERNY